MRKLLKHGIASATDGFELKLFHVLWSFIVLKTVGTVIHTVTGMLLLVKNSGPVMDVYILVVEWVQECVV